MNVVQCAQLRSLKNDQIYSFQSFKKDDQIQCFKKVDEIPSDL